MHSTVAEILHTVATHTPRPVPRGNPATSTGGGMLAVLCALGLFGAALVYFAFSQRKRASA